MVGKGVSLREVDGTRPMGMPGWSCDKLPSYAIRSRPSWSRHWIINSSSNTSFLPQQTVTTMSPMRRSNQQASRCTPSSPSSSSSQGSNAWVNSFSQGGVGLTGSNYMTPRGEYISQPPCSRVTLQTGTSYPNTDKVTNGFILLVDRG